MTAFDDRLSRRAGELGVTLTGTGPYTMTRYYGHSINGTESVKAYRPRPSDAPVLTASPATLEAAERVLNDWTGVAYLSPNRPL